VTQFNQITQACVAGSEYHFIQTTLESEFRYASQFRRQNATSLTAIHLDGSRLTLSWETGTLKLKKGNAPSVPLNTEWRLSNVTFTQISSQTILISFWEGSRNTHQFCLTCVNGYVTILFIFLILAISLALGTASVLLRQQTQETTLLYWHQKTLYLAHSGWSLAQAYWDHIPTANDPLTHAQTLSPHQRKFPCPIPLDGHLYLIKTPVALYSIGQSQDHRYQLILRQRYSTSPEGVRQLTRTERW
jgi:hypothetical protein